MAGTGALVGILMGSDSDLPIMSEAAATLKKFGVPCEVEISSAHRSPARTSEYARTAIERGLKVIIIGAGGAAHLGGVVAAEKIHFEGMQYRRDIGRRGLEHHPPKPDGTLPITPNDGGYSAAKLPQA